MKINFKRIEKAQQLMVKEGMVGIMIMNYDDYRYFFGDIRTQPRAIIPASGEPILITFKAEEPELKETLGNVPVKIFSHVGEQIMDVRTSFKGIIQNPDIQAIIQSNTKPRVGMQMFFHTPAFLVDLFRQVNPKLELVSSAPVMDELRMVKEPDEIKLMNKAQVIAGKGMDVVGEILRPGITGHELATEALYVMMKEGAEGTSTPIYVNAGKRSCWIHGKIDKYPIQQGDLVVVDLTPQFEGYCANLTRTFTIGNGDDQTNRLIETYIEMKEETRLMLKPEVTPRELDSLGKKICQDRGFGEYHIDGISHGIGLRFEETPASTIVKKHRSVQLRENMTMTIGHTILAIPGVGGARFEDVYQVTPDGGRILHPYPLNG
ncbi:MAG: M24 family metallopeptidase [Candidatus Thorarchaeota archaeon]